jgi:hypothetical protein
MKTKWMLLGLVIPLGIILWVTRPRPKEPTYQGIGLASWVRQLNEGDDSSRHAAALAIRVIDQQAVPSLIRELAPRDGRLRDLVMRIDRRLPRTQIPAQERFLSIEAERGYAAKALGVIGPGAKASVPALLKMSFETNSFCAARARAALIQICGEPKDSLTLPATELDHLTNWLQQGEILLCLGSNITTSAECMAAEIGRNKANRFQIVESLGRNKREPDASVLLLRALLKDSESALRQNVVNMLIMQRSFARSSRADLLECAKNDDEAGVRAHAEAALRFVFLK